MQPSDSTSIKQSILQMGNLPTLSSCGPQGSEILTQQIEKGLKRKEKIIQRNNLSSTMNNQVTRKLRNEINP